MSTVTNPYTFNIKSNCGFSTNALVSNNTFNTKLTMIYSTDDVYTSIYLNYASNISGSSLNPDRFDKIYIKSISLECGNTTIDSTLKCTIITANTNSKYSKMILNGGLFDNFKVEYNELLFTEQFTYEGSVVGIADPAYWKGYYNGVPFDLTIKFV